MLWWCDDCRAQANTQAGGYTFTHADVSAGAINDYVIPRPFTQTSSGLGAEGVAWAKTGD